ncbi:MAG: anti-sigma factor domain-containing protein [Pseudonocardiaceae bacterium]
MNNQQRLADCPHRELAVGWALHALEPAEESLVAAHMPECPTCTSTAAQAEELSATLGLSVPEVIPSAELEQRVLSVTGARWAAPVVPLAPPTQLTPSARRITTPSWLRTGELAAAVILVAAALVLGVRVVQLGGELNQAQHQVTDMTEAIQSAEDPAALRVPLFTKDGGAVVGMVLASPNRVSVVATRLPSNRVADQTYVLWGLTGGAPIALTAFDVALPAPRLNAVPAATGTSKFTGYAVSLEPGRRTPAVPTDIVATSR